MIEFNAHFSFMCLYIVYIKNIIFGKHFFIDLAAYWSPFVTNIFKQFINLFVVGVVVVKIVGFSLKATAGATTAH